MATELGKAYVQIMPSARGIKGKISKELEPESKSAGLSAGHVIGATLKKAIGAAAIGEMLRKTISEGANLEQSIGGIETLFGKASEAAKLVQKNAKNAYKESQISANDYMEQVTSFSARLLQSTGGDTLKSAKIADVAIKDMTDNANKMGTSLGDIQNAYQGFAKDNYTMLDNLRLGYGGTKEEMQRLLNNAEKVTGIHYDMSNFDDVISAIHVVQKGFGMTGTSAEEARTTVEGSFNAMKAAAHNFMGAISLGEDIKPALVAMAETTHTFLVGNLIPMLGTVLKSIGVLALEGISKLFATAIPTLTAKINEMATHASGAISENLPQFLEKGIELVKTIVSGMMQSLPGLIIAVITLSQSIKEGIASALPEIMEKGKEIVISLLTIMSENLPQFLEKGKEFAMTLYKGIKAQGPILLEQFLRGLTEFNENLTTKIKEFSAAAAEAVKTNGPVIMEKLGELLKDLIKVIIEHGPQFSESAAELIKAMICGIGQMTAAILGVLAGVIAKLLAKLVGAIGQFIASGVKIIAGVARGIMNAIGQVLNAIGNVIRQAVRAIISAVGQFIQAGRRVITGLARGIRAAIGLVLSAVRSIIERIKSAFRIDWGSIGRNVIRGIRNGIVNGAGAVARAAANAAKNAFNAAKSVLGIHSPSRKFAWIGKMVTAGYAQGIERNTGSVENAMKEMSEATLGDAEQNIRVRTSAIAVKKDFKGNNTNIEMLLNDLIDIISADQRQIVLDTGVLCGELAHGIDRALGRAATLNRRRG